MVRPLPYGIKIYHPVVNFGQSKWLIDFTGVDEGTKVTVNIHFQSIEAMNQQIEMGFEEGFKTGLNQLEEILKG